MSLVVTTLLVMASCKPKQAAPTESSAGPEIELVQAAGPVRLSAAATRALTARVEKALSVCNFTSAGRPEIFGGTDVEELWRQRERGPHLRLRYPKLRSIDAVAGQLSFREVLLSVGAPYGPEPALVKDSEVLGLKKCGYDDRFLGCDPELAPHFPKPASCPPGF